MRLPSLDPRVGLGLKIFTAISAILYLATYLWILAQVWLFGTLMVQSVPHTRVDITAAFLIVGMLFWWIVSDRRSSQLSPEAKEQGVELGIQITATFSAILYLVAFVLTSVEIALADSLILPPIVHTTLDIVYIFIIVVMLGWWLFSGRRGRRA